MPESTLPALTVAVAGAGGPLETRVLAALGERDDVRTIVELPPLAPLPGGLQGVDVLVVLAVDPFGRPGLVGADVAWARRLLEAAGTLDVRSAVVLSSAMVYGAWPANPVPLTEEAPVRPVPGVAHATAAAEVERLASEWVAEGAERRCAVLRPAIVVDQGFEGELSRALRHLDRRKGADPPRQFVLLDDLAAAVVVAATGRVDGACNVTARGWIQAEQVRALAGTFRVRLPGRSEPSWRALAPYARHPWVVAADRLEAEGWSPSSTVEEAFVAAHRGSPWTRLSPRRRQELLLGSAGATLLALAVAAIVGLRRRRR